MPDVLWNVYAFFEKKKQNKKKATATTTAKQYTGTALTCEGFVKGTGIQSKAQKRFPRLLKNCDVSEWIHST